MAETIGTALTTNLPGVRSMLGRKTAMIQRALGVPCLAELDAMIARAEAACERYRQRAAARGLSPPFARKRRAASEKMEELLARLRVQRATVADQAGAADHRVG
jgi:hypothetical protein